MGQIRVETIPVCDLLSFAQNAEKDQERYEVLPITEIKALSHTKNPAASPDDIGLLVAYYGEKCVGYLGILPCLLWHKRKLSKVYALSTFFVHESFRRKLVAITIMADLIKLGYDFSVTGLSPIGENFFRSNKQWFKPAGPLSYLHIHVLPISSVLWTLGNRLNQTRGIFHSLLSLNRRFAEAGGWSFFYRLLQSSCKICDEIEVRPVCEIHATKGKNATLPGENKFYFYRDEKIVNWMIRYPWITEDSNIKLNYYFSYQRELFRFLPFELYARQSGKRLGYVVLNITKKRGLKLLKILDYALSDKTYLPFILWLALKEASRWKAELIVVPQKLWPYIRSHILLNLLTVHRERVYFLHKNSKKSPLPEQLQNICLDYCDSDSAFT